MNVCNEMLKVNYYLILLTNKLSDDQNNGNPLICRDASEKFNSNETHRNEE